MCTVMATPRDWCGVNLNAFSPFSPKLVLFCFECQGNWNFVGLFRI